MEKDKSEVLGTHGTAAEAAASGVGDIKPRTPEEESEDLAKEKEQENAANTLANSTLAGTSLEGTLTGSNTTSAVPAIEPYVRPTE